MDETLQDLFSGRLSARGDRSQRSARVHTASEEVAVADNSGSNSEAVAVFKPAESIPGESASTGVWSWGSAAHGRLGTGEGLGATGAPPQIIPSMKGKPITRIACGFSFCVALTDRGQLYSWGGGVTGVLGHGDQKNRHSPCLIQAVAHIVMADVDCGSNHSLCVAAEGTVFSWGSNRHGKLGHGYVPPTTTRPGGMGAFSNQTSRGMLTTRPATERATASDKFTPTRIEGMGGTPAKAVACGEHHSACISQDGQVFTWGDGTFGKLGHDSIESEGTPRELANIMDKGGACQVALGKSHTMILCISGELLACGDGTYGQLGVGGDDGEMVRDRRRPTPIEALTGQSIKHVACGETFTAAVSSTGALMWWGGWKNTGLHSSALGNDLAVIWNPAPVMELHAKVATRVACGPRHIMAVMSNGEVYSWGSASSGRLGYGLGSNSRFQPGPQHVHTMQGHHVVEIACGGEHTVAITSESVAGDTTKYVDRPDDAKPAVDVYNSGVSTLSDSLVSAVSMIDSMGKAGLSPMPEYYERAIQLCIECQKLPLAVSLFTDAAGNRVAHQLHPLVIQKLVKTLSQHGEESLMKDAMQVIQGSPFAMREGASDTIIQACVAANQCDVGVSLLQDMVKASLVPRLETFNALIREFFRAVQVEQAFRLLKNMEAAGRPPEESTYNAMLMAIDEMTTVDPNTAVMMFTEILRNCRGEPSFRSENPMFARTLKQFGKKGVLNKVMETIEQIAMETGVDDDLDDSLEPPDDDAGLVDFTTADYNTMSAQDMPSMSDAGSIASGTGGAPGYSNSYGAGLTGRADWEEMARGQLSGRYVPVTPHPGTQPLRGAGAAPAGGSSASSKGAIPVMYNPNMPGGLGAITEDDENEGSARR